MPQFEIHCHFDTADYEVVGLLTAESEGEASGIFQEWMKEDSFTISTKRGTVILVDRQSVRYIEIIAPTILP